MGLFDFILDNLSSSSTGGSQGGHRSGVIDYGDSKVGGGHDHRHNKGKDRTPAQLEGDRKRRKDQADK